jgi:hypothetical protein
MTERRYTDDEVATIFKQAAAEQHTAPQPVPAAEGMTLVQLQEIGSEVGIPAELVARAARSLEHAGQPVSRTLLGLPVGVGRTIELPRRLTDPEWEQVVGDLRETFQATGRLRYEGPFRQWSNGNLSVMLEPTPTGHRLRMQTLNSQSQALMATGMLMTGLGVILSVVVLVAGKAEGLAGSGVLLAVGLGLLGTGAFRLPGWARLRRRQMAGLAARLALAAEAPPPGEPPAAPPA